jgi:hypothetical protein
MSRLGIVLIVACLVLDMATPLCPGAFRFDPAQSIEGAESRAVIALPPHTDAPSLPGHEAPHAALSRFRNARVGDLVARPRLRPIWPRAALASTHLGLAAPRSSEDG